MSKAESQKSGIAQGSNVGSKGFQRLRAAIDAANMQEEKQFSESYINRKILQIV